MMVSITYSIISSILILASLLTFVRNQHWVFRMCEFARIQLTVLLLIMIIGGLVWHHCFLGNSWLLLTIMTFLCIYHIVILGPYISLSRRNPAIDVAHGAQPISALSINVFQFNKEYKRLIEMVNRVNPDILLTMETNESWEKALAIFDSKYKFYKKIAQENTYGMHFYSNVKVVDVQVNYFMADDVPSIKVSLESAEGRAFLFYGIHPPPPSPTEERTSKERDGELMTIAKQARKSDLPILVVGDFNNVAWSRSSKLFREISGLIDVRIGRGFVSTFHAKYRLLRFPIDLLFHSRNIIISEFKSLEHIGSDHLPLYWRFAVTSENHHKKVAVEPLNEEEMKRANEMIKEGRDTQSDRPETITQMTY